MTLPERIEALTRGWDHWSQREQERMDEIVEEVLAHCRDGQGNRFIREFVRRAICPHVTLFSG